jgi:DNA-binding transcriptional LysR family regulator
VEGQVVVTNTYQKLEAALAGLGIATMPEDLAQPHVDRGALRWVLEEWFPTLPGQHAYYPSRRQSSRALQVVVEALRYRS